MSADSLPPPNVLTRVSDVICLTRPYPSAGMRNEGTRFEMVDGGPFDGNKAYKDSKLLNILFARELAGRLAADGVGITCNAFSPGFIPTSRLFRNQGSLAQAFLKYVFNMPPLATTLPVAGTYMCEMVLGEEKGVKTGTYFCGPPDYQPEGEPTFLGFYRGLMYPQFKARQPSEEARRAELGCELWELSEVLVQQTFDALDREAARAMGRTTPRSANGETKNSAVDRNRLMEEAAGARVGMGSK